MTISIKEMHISLMFLCEMLGMGINMKEGPDQWRQ